MLRYVSSNTTRALQFFQAARFGSTLLISILLVRAIVDDVAVAHYEQWIFAANLLSFFWAMGLTKAALSFYPTLSVDQRSSFLFSSTFLLSLIGIGSGILGYFFASNLQGGLGLSAFPYWTEAMILLVFSMPLSLIETRFTLLGQSKKIVNYSVLSYSSILLAALVCFLVFKDEYLFIQVYLIWTLVRWIYLQVLNWGKLDSLLLKKYFYYSIPLVLHIILGNGMEYIDGILVNHYFEVESFPIFRYGARELPISSILVGGIVASLIPLYLQNKEGTLSSFKTKISKLIRWVFPMAMILILVSPLLYKLVYGEAFIESAYLFNIYLLILVSRVLLPQIIIQAKHQNKILVYSALIELLVNIGLSIFLLQYFGLIGIAMATWVAYMVNKVILLGYVKFKMKVPLSSYLNQRVYILYSICLLLSFWISWQVYH